MKLLQTYLVPFVVAFHGNTVNRNRTQTRPIILHYVFCLLSVALFLSVEVKWLE